MHVSQKSLLNKKMRYIFVFACFSLLTISGYALQQSRPVYAQSLNVTAASIRAAGATACASPPANFNPLTASNTELLYYGFPNKDPQHLSQWLQVVEHSKHRGCNFVTEKHPASTSSARSPLSPHAKSAALRPNTTQSYDYSHNWSGYVVGDGTPTGFNAIEGSWHNPCLLSSRTSVGSQMAMWVGMGGWVNDSSQYSGDIWQAGTEVETGGPYEAGSPSHPVYHLWYETFPTQDWQVDYSQNLSCGDVIWGYVDYNYTVAYDNYYYVDDETNGDYISGYIVPGGLQIPDVTYAEWIDERPSCPPLIDGYHQLPDFNYMEWSSLEVKPTSSSNFGALNSYYNTQATMYEARSPYYNLTSPGSIGSDGKSFHDNFANDGNGNDNSC